MLESIPVTESDQPVDFIATDEEVIQCDGQKGA
jgi:5-formyltetrahydrofolate cyclo-ligase